MHKTFTTQENGKQINNTIPDNAISIFGDGFGPAMIGYPHSKITLFQEVLSTDPDVIEREITATVVIPTVALVELANHVKRIMQENKEQLSSDVEVHLQKMFSQA